MNRINNLWILSHHIGVDQVDRWPHMKPEKKEKKAGEKVMIGNKKIIGKKK